MSPLLVREVTSLGRLPVPQVKSPNSKVRIIAILKRSIFFTCAALSLTLLAGCKGGQSGPAAIVNGQTISMDDYVKWLQLKPQVQVIVNPATLQAPPGGPIPQQPYNGQVVGSLALQAMTDLVKQTIVEQMATDDKVYPSSKDIDDELNDRRKQNPNFVKDLADSGFPLPMIQKQIALQLAEYNLTTEGVNVSEDEVTKYIKDHPKEFVVPAGVDMLWMLVPDEAKKKAADAELKAGNTFIIVAQKYSAAPNTRQMQYHFPEQSIPRLAAVGGPEFMKAVEKTPELQQTDWLKFSDGWAKFYVNKKTPEKALSIDDAMRKKVKKALMMQKGQQGKDLNQRIADKVRNSKIEIAIDFLKAPWQRSIESLQPSTPTNTTTTPPDPNGLPR